ncbi:glutathione S-transferase N-terminal domain-containing protein [Candidatus Woesearchaeota archaeon]|nr:glutathione S-transferase N-terminal domain-containing protein [Candidatus Woesearchaeota archaeon]
MAKTLKSKIGKESKVKIYTTTTCPWCMKTKEFLKANNVKYEEVNVGENEQARNEMFEKSGQFGVPVSDVNGTIIVGYDKEALKKALGLDKEAKAA